MRQPTPAILFNPLSGNLIAWFIASVCFAINTYFNDSFGLVSGSVSITTGVIIGGVWSTRLHAWREAYRIEVRKISINHRQRFVLRVIVALLIAGLIHLPVDGFTAAGYVRTLNCALFLGGIFWLHFDFFLNHDRGKALFYVSSWYKSAAIDGFFHRLNSPLLWLLSKIVLFLLTYTVYQNSL